MNLVDKILEVSDMLIENISGENREINFRGTVYVFPFPANGKPTNVPNELGEQLRPQKYFKEVKTTKIPEGIKNAI